MTALSLQSHGTIVLTRSTEGFSAPLARFFQSILLCSSPYQTLNDEVELPAISWVEMFYIHLPTPLRNYTDLWMCQPNLRSGASSGNRTHAYSLEDCSTSRYTIPAFIAFLRFLHIYYTRIFKKSQILWREVAESNCQE